MRIQFNGISIECDASEIESALSALRAMASIAPSGAPSVTRANVAQTSAPCDALRELLRAKGIGFKYRPDGKDKGRTLENALFEACQSAGVPQADIESAMQSAPLGDALESLEVPSAETPDKGESFF